MREEERRSGPVSSGPDIPVGWSGGPVRSGPSGPVWYSLVLFGLVRSSLVWSGLLRSIPVGLVRSGLVWCLVQSVRSGPVWISGPVLGPAGAVHVLLVCRNTTLCWLVHSLVYVCVTIKKGTRTSFCLCFVSNNNQICYVLQ